MIWDFRLDNSGDNECIEIFEIALLHACLSKHPEQLTKEVVYSAHTDAELSSHSQCLLRDAFTFLKLPDTRVDILPQ